MTGLSVEVAEPVLVGGTLLESAEFGVELVVLLMCWRLEAEPGRGLAEPGLKAGL